MYRRELDGRELVFLHAGYVYQGSFVMFDTETESDWLHVTGEAVMGPLKGKSLEFLPTRLVTWKEWKAAHPDTTVLKSQKKWSDVHRRELAFDKAESREQLGLNVVAGRQSKLYPFPVLESAGVINDVHNSEPLAAVYIASAECGVAWKRTLDESVLTFRIEPVDGHIRLVDRDTESVWHPLSGIALEGPLKGSQLEPLITIPIRTSRYRFFYPEGAIFVPDSRIRDRERAALFQKCAVGFLFGFLLGFFQSLLCGRRIGSWQSGIAIAWGFAIAIPTAISAILPGWYCLPVGLALSVAVFSFTKFSLRRNQQLHTRQ